MSNKFNSRFESNFSLLELSDEQLYTVLPNWNDILNLIEDCRNTAVEYKNVKEKKTNSNLLSDMAPDILEHTRFCNIFSIIGGRGSGKSSVLYTLRKKIIEKSAKKGDIVLPLVIPELVDDDNNMIGWILSSLKPIIEKLDEKYYKRTYESGFFSDCQGSTFSLHKLYTDLSKKCFNADSSAHYTYQENQGILRDKSVDRVKFYDELSKFWELLSYTAARYNEDYLNLRETHPMIVLMFDDIDLSPERCMELLVNNMNCFSNINVIVIVSAAYKSLKPAIECKMFEKITGTTNQSWLVDNCIEDLVRNDKQFMCVEKRPIVDRNMVERAAIAFIDKTLPPTSRFFIEKFASLDKKQTFRYICNDGNVIDINNLLFNCLNKLTNKAIDLNDKFLNKSRNFYPMDKELPLFFENSSSRQTTIKIYMAIFGDKSRSMTNGCTAIYNVSNLLYNEVCACINEIEKSNIENEKNIRWNSYSERVYNIIIQFISEMLDSNPDNNHNSNDIAKELVKFRYNNHEIFIDYDYVMFMYKRESSYLRDNYSDIYRNERVSLNKKYLSIYMILAFAENLIAITIYKKSRVHIIKHLVEFVKSYLESESIFYYEPYQDRDFFENYSDLLEMLFTTSKTILSDNDSLDIFLCSVGTKRALNCNNDSRMNMLKELSRLYNTDHEYCMTLIKAMMMRFSGITSLNIKWLPEANKTLALFSNWSSIHHNNAYRATRIAQLSCAYQREKYEIIGNKEVNYEKIIQNIVGKYEKRYSEVSGYQYIDLEILDNCVDECLRDTLCNDKKHDVTYIPRVLIDYASIRTRDNGLKRSLSIALNSTKKPFTCENTILSIQKEMLTNLYSVLSKLSVKYNSSMEQLKNVLEKSIMGQTPSVDCAVLILLRNCDDKNDYVNIAMGDLMNLLDEVNKCIIDLNDEESNFHNIYKNMATVMDEEIRKIVNATKLCWIAENGLESIREAIDFIFTLKLYVISSAYLCSLENSNNIRDNLLNRTSNALEVPYKQFVKGIVKNEYTRTHSIFTRDANMCILTESSNYLYRQIHKNARNMEL